MSGRPLIVTMGDPAGVGPEIIAKAWPILATPPGPLAPVTPFAVVGDGVERVGLARRYRRGGRVVQDGDGAAEDSGGLGRAEDLLHRRAERR